MNYKQQIALIGGGFSSLVAAYSLGKASIYQVETGQKAFKFNKFSGCMPTTYAEGWHLKIPYFERAVVYNVKAQALQQESSTGSKDLQTVRIALRVLYRPDGERLQEIYRFLGMDYDQRVLPSVVNEILKSVVAQYNAATLMVQREQISQKIKVGLEQRLREFHIVLDDVSIVELQFGQEFKQAIEQKQIAQQQAERAKFLVEQAMQDKRSTIIKAQGEALSAENFGKAIEGNPAYIDLKRIEAARDIARMLGQSRNKVYLDADSLLLNLTNPVDNMLVSGSAQTASVAAVTAEKSQV